MIVVKLNNTDISSYLISMSDVPIVLRNRDWSPIFNGIDFVVSYNGPVIPARYQKVEIFVNNIPHYLGRVAKVKFNYSNYTYEVKVDHFLLALDQHKINFFELNSSLIEGTADFTNKVAFIQDMSNIDLLLSTSHGLLDGDIIQFTSTGTLPTPLIENHNYYIKKMTDDSFYVFYDFANFVTSQDISQFAQVIRAVEFGGTGSGTHYYTSVIDTNLYKDEAVFRDIPIDTIDLVKDQIISAVKDRDGGYPVGSYNVDHAEWFRSRFTIVAFSGDNLPSPLTNDRAYIAAKFPEDEGFVLYDHITSYVTNAKIDLAGSYSTDIYYSVLQRFSVFNREMIQEENYDDNASYPTPFVQLKWFVKRVFDKIGVTLITDAIDGVILHKLITYEWNWSEVYLFESMLYNINQFSPIKPADITVDDSEHGMSQITILEFIQDLFGKLGIALKYEGINEGGLAVYRLISQKRNAGGFPTPANEDWFEIEDKHKLAYETDQLDQDDLGGWSHSRFIAGTSDAGLSTSLSFVYNDREKYNGYSPTNIEYNHSRFGVGENDIVWFNNLIFFLKRKTSSGGTPEGLFVQLPTITTQLYNITIAGSTYSILVNQKNSYNKDWTIRKITCRLNYLSQETWSVKELFLDVKNRRIKIVQERTAI